MATSRTAAAIDAVVAGAGAALTNVLVLDGEVTDDPGDWLFVGIGDPDDEGFAKAAETRHAWAGLGNHARNQEGDIWCVAQASSGDSMKAARDAAFAIVAAVETFLRADPTLGGVLTPGWARHGTSEDLEQLASDQGWFARVPFQIYFQSRL